MTELTTRQQQVIDAIKDSVNERGYPPTIREIGKTVGLSSSSTVWFILENLIKKGYITKGDGVRTIRVV